MADPNTTPTNGGPNTNGRPTFANPNFLDKKGLGSMRQSTPDSEVLEPSDEEHENHNAMSMSMHSTKSVPAGNVQRRASWMSEVQSAKQQRKFSMSGVSHASSGSQPTTPLGENGPWDMTNNARPGTAATGHMWSSQIWQKDRSSRLHEVMPSPTGSFHEDMRSPTNLAGNGLPFEIPLEPNRKTIRSQSYSAGQLEGMPGMEHLHNPVGYRTRAIAHRPSRPSMLGDGSRDMLSSLREDEDDTEDSGGSDQGYPLRTTTSLQSNVRGTAFTPFAKAPSPLAPNSGFKFQTRSTFPLSPGSDYAVADEGDDQHDNFSELAHSMARGLVGSNASSTTNMQSLAAASQNRQASGLRKSQWQSSLGFDVQEDGSQSRRHSFAAEQLPSRTRHNSMVVPADANQQRYNAFGGIEPNFSSQPIDQHEMFQHGVSNDTEPNYFGGAENFRRNLQDASEGYNPFALPNVFSRPQRILFLVVFKCSRADVYYIPENTGLQVRTGDTVIVEGDRGQDLGTVEAVNITMEQAKKLRMDYLRKHFKCLMMFSRIFPHVVSIANDDEQFDLAILSSKNATQNSVVGGHTHGGANGQGPRPDADPRPKMIKRVARPDEVHLLREKEGNEAKAKRVCQTKVNDHGLRMEILDAEFQHDYRKLTFYYYAEEYINFNDLVTELFKVYKTRIWMSAINPASFNGAGNPHTGQRQAQWPRQGSTGAGLLLPSPEPVRTHSPQERDTPAARGDREYQRLYGNAPYGMNHGMSNAMGMNAPLGSFPNVDDLNSSMASAYNIRRGNNPFSPTANQFTPFANQQYGGVPGHPSWPNGPLMQLQSYPGYAEAGNHLTGPAVGATPGLSQQASPFSPRASMGRGQQGSNYPQNGQQGANYPQTGQPKNKGFQNGDLDVNKLGDNFNKFNIDPRPLQ